MNLNLMIEPSYSETYWCKAYMQGITDRSNRLGYALNLLDAEDLTQIGVLTAVKENRHIILLIGITYSWTQEKIAWLSRMGIHCIVIPHTQPPPNCTISCVTMNYSQAISILMQYLLSLYRSKIALFGVNVESTSDRQKEEAYLAFMSMFCGKDAAADVFYNQSLISKTVRDFYDQINQYDAVICANDLAAILLIQFLATTPVRIPEHLYLVSFGSTLLSEVCSPSITAIRLHYYDVGRQAVYVYAMLNAKPEFSSLTASIDCKISLGETTAFMPTGQYSLPPSTVDHSQTNRFFADPDVQELFCIEQMIAHCDDVDINLIKGLIGKTRYIDLAGMLYISESALKYRLKKILDNTQLNNREELIALLGKYLGSLH